MFKTNELSDKFINHLITTNTSDSVAVEDNYKALIQSVWDAARQNAPRSKPKNVVTEYVQSNHELLERIFFAREVIRNTLRKTTYGVYPAEFNWVWGNSVDIVITGIYRRGSSWNRTDERINDKLINGTYTYSDNDYVKFSVKGLGHDAREYTLDLRYLNNDPVAIAQMVRRLAKANAKKHHDEKVAEVYKNLTEAEKNLEALKTQYKNLKDKKIGK
jgi:hypothetical protein